MPALLNNNYTINITASIKPRVCFNPIYIYIYIYVKVLWGHDDVMWMIIKKNTQPHDTNNVIIWTII